jgi:hypothetical protein
MSGGPFSPRLLAAWIGAALLVFALTLYFMGGGGTASGEDATGPSSFSRSAIGYAGLAEILHRLDIPVVKSRYGALAKLGQGGVLVVAEPPIGIGAFQAVRGLQQAKRGLLILPKWHGKESDSHTGWIADAELLPLGAATFVLDLAVPKATVVRDDGVPPWTIARIGPLPTLEGPIQLIQSDRLRPVIGSKDGMLLGELVDKGRHLWVLADPDILANHGISRAGNAALAVALVDAMRAGAAGSIVFDEAVHGYVAEPANPARLLFRFPFSFATAQAGLAILLLLWATVGRFGAPEAAPPRLDAGKGALIRNAAQLIDYAGHRPVMVRRYVQSVLHDVARQLHAPRGLEGGALMGWLGRLAEARSVSIDGAALAEEAERRTDDAGLAAVARAIHQWKGEMLDGAQRDKNLYRGAEGRGAQGRRRAG